MIVKAIYHGLQQVYRIIHNGVTLFQRSPVTFHLIDGDKLIIVGALSAVSLPDGLYLDCKPDVDWVYPVLENGVLTISQAYTAAQNGTTLEVG